MLPLEALRRKTPPLRCGSTAIGTAADARKRKVVPRSRAFDKAARGQKSPRDGPARPHPLRPP